MFLGCLSAPSVGKICFLKRSIATVYEDVLGHFFIPYIEDVFGKNKFIFHDAKSTKEWFREKIPVLDCLKIANPIGNLWEIVNRRLRKHYPSKSDKH